MLRMTARLKGSLLVGMFGIAAESVRTLDYPDYVMGIEEVFNRVSCPVPGLVA